MQETQRVSRDRSIARAAANERHSQGKRHPSGKGTRSRGRTGSVGARARYSRGGYSIQKQRSINFAGKRGRLRRFSAAQIIVLGLAVIVAIVLVVALVTGVKSCVASRATTLDSSLSQDTAEALQTRLDQDEKIAAIANNAAAYPESLIKLALAEPTAVDFVYNYPTADTSTNAAYTGTLTAGTVPIIYTYNPSWGYLTYANQPLAVTGSGPTTLAMALYSLTQDAQKTIGDIATQAASAGAASGDAFSSDALFTSVAPELGLSATSLLKSSEDAVAAAQEEAQTAASETASSSDTTSGDGSSDTATSEATSSDATATSTGEIDALLQEEVNELLAALNAGNVVAIQTPSSSALGSARWVLAVAAKSDGSVVIHDPLSAINTARAWDPGTILQDAASAFVLKKAE
jgi:hypothetical protein